MRTSSLVADFLSHRFINRPSPSTRNIDQDLFFASTTGKAPADTWFASYKMRVLNRTLHMGKGREVPIFTPVKGEMELTRRRRTHALSNINEKRFKFWTDCMHSRHDNESVLNHNL